MVATWVSTNLRFQYRLFTHPGLLFGLFILQIIIVVALSASVMRLSTGVAALLFLLYSALTGLTFSSLFIVYTDEQIASVFWVAAGMFLLMSLVGLLLKRDMSGAGGIILMLLLGWIVAWFFSILFNLSEINWLLTFIGIALFAGLTAWDTQRLKKMGQQLDDHPARGGLIVMGALSLYLDFINLFLLLLRASSRN
ncbi:MAG: Bax inhibitor-1/YccA family protein [Chloroflexi bacterium]|nr:Bax inhibitor-1/YccA family protein [Chloroflexota bacterium]